MHVQILIKKHGYIRQAKHALKWNPDVEALNDSGGSGFSAIDVKLANAFSAMINSAGDNGREVGMEIKVKTLDMARSIHPKVMKGRHIVAMVLQSLAQRKLVLHLLGNIFTKRRTSETQSSTSSGINGSIVYGP